MINFDSPDLYITSTITAILLCRILSVQTYDRAGNNYFSFQPSNTSSNRIPKLLSAAPAATIACRKNIAKMASAPNELVGAAGCRYRFKELIQEKPSLGRVWLATSETPRQICYLTRKLTLFQIWTRSVYLERYSKRHLLQLQ